MRDIALTIIIFGTLPYILRHPYVGVLVWSWLSYMNPHRMTWGFAYNFPFAQIVAITLLVSLLLDKEPKRLPKHWLLFFWFMFLGWMLITTLNAYYPDKAWVQFIKVLKIQLIIFLILLVMHSPERIKMMVWVIFFSIGFFGIKGGVFTIVTGGGYRVWGPGGFIQDNNALALALIMVLPLGFYLVRNEVEQKWAKVGLWASMFLITVAVLGSQSRGAFLAIICVAFYLWLKSDKKLVMAVFVIPILPIMFLAMPASWHDRMSTIQNYQQDASAMGRINAWTYSVNAANENFTGVGFESWSGRTFAIWAPNPENVHSAHSIYFSVIADHGWVGFGMFMTIFFGAFLVARRVGLVAARHDEYRWAGDLAKMTQVSLVAYGTGGAFLSLSYFDLPWHLVAIIILLQDLMKREGIWEEEKPKPIASRRMPASRGNA